MSSIKKNDLLIKNAIDHLIGNHVPVGLSNADLKNISDKKNEEARYERGQSDNFYTANKLNFEADMYLIAFDIKETGASETLEKYKQIMKYVIRDVLNEEYHIDYLHLHGAVEYVLNYDDKALVLEIIDELVEEGIIEKDNKENVQEIFENKYKNNLIDMEIAELYSSSSPEIVYGNNPTPKIDEVIQNSILHLMRKEGVPFTATRLEIEKKAKELSSEGSLETSWDNYSTGARLQSQAFVTKLIAEVRHPREGDRSLDVITSQLNDILLNRIIYDIHPDSDQSSASLEKDSILFSALYRSMDVNDVDLLKTLIDEYGTNNYIDNPEDLKEEVEDRINRDKLNLFN